MQCLGNLAGANALGVACVGRFAAVVPHLAVPELYAARASLGPSTSRFLLS